MNDRYSTGLQYDMNSSSKYVQMVMQDPNYSISNSTSINSAYQMQMNNRPNYSVDDINSNMHNMSMNNNQIDFMSNNSHYMNMFTDKMSSNSIRSTQSSNLERSGNGMSRFANFLNGQSSKLPQMVNPVDNPRMYPNPIGNNTIMSSQSSGFQNSNNFINKIPISATSHIQKSLINSEKMNQTAASTVFYSESNIKELNQQQMDNELVNPNWITFPPIHESAEQLRQGKQHLTVNRVDNPIFVNNDLRKIYHARISSCLLNASNKVNGAKIPDIVNNYIDITPLESTFEIRKSKSFNRPSICYKAYNKTANEYVLFRRFPGLILNSNYEQKINDFRNINHPGLISVKQVFSTNAFDDNSTIFIMEYLPYCATALQIHLSDVGKLLGYSAPFNVTQQARPYSAKKLSDLNCLPEDRAWCYLIQIINSVRFIHNTIGLSCRLLDPSKIIIQYPNRIKLNCFGVQDILTSDKSYTGPVIEHSSKILALQSTDLENLGKLMLCLICGTSASLEETNFSVALELLEKNYSNNMKTIVIGLINSKFESINEVASCTFAECYNHISLLYEHIDYLEYNLMKELECGRLFRLVCKLGTICERNELGMDNNWSDYGPNYQLKLFRDFVFHQVDADGLPYLDLAHIVTSLNKLDCGSEDSVCLISRDRKNMFCVTFAELKKVLDDSFDQLLNAHKAQSNNA